MVIDCFIFNDELDMLEFRMEEHNDYFDYFVLVESELTHSGLKKPLYFLENKSRFSKFSHKIIHVIAELPEHISENLTPEEYYEILNKPMYPNIGDCYNNNNLSKKSQYYWGPWIREHLQRDSVSIGLEKLNLNDSDIIYLSDVDEIIDGSILDIISGKKNNFLNFPYKIPIDRIYCVIQKFYYYNLECTMNHNWNFAKIFNYKLLKEVGNCNSIRYINTYPPIGNYGWHFSYFGGANQIINKLKSFSHQEFVNNDIIDEKNIKYKIQNSLDVLNRDGGEKNRILGYVPFNEKNYWPKKINFLKKLFKL
jgi:beta-1,4-mannosyl-glycoprotein beta-1,4-N-acetylglucosaminyltransferase